MRLIDAEGIRIKPEFMYDICGMAMIRVEDIVRIINEQPTIQPKRGKWIDRGEHESGGRHWHEWECNICHHYFDERTFFCPHCGADMRGEQYG